LSYTKIYLINLNSKKTHLPAIYKIIDFQIVKNSASNSVCIGINDVGINVRSRNDPKLRGFFRFSVENLTRILDMLIRVSMEHNIPERRF